MKSKKYLIYILIVLVMTISLLTNIQSHINAEELGSVDIIKSINQDKNNLNTNEDIKNITYGLIRISEQEINDYDKKNEILKNLSKLELSEIENKYSKLGKLITSQPTDKMGKTTVNSLKTGTYYVFEIKKENGIIKISTSVPFLLSVVKNKNNTIYPKSTIPFNGKQISVKKVWVGEKLSKVEIYLYANGNKIDEVELNDSNNWQHTFMSLATNSDNGKTINYTISEVPISGYTSKIEKNNDETYVVTNTKNNIDKKIIDESKKIYGSIIKTGDWTIYFLVGIGIIFMAIGYKVYKKSSTLENTINENK